MSDILILGGTRNLGHFAALRSLEAGHSVAVLNRGITPDELPPDVERLRGTRGDVSSLRSALGNREFDLVIDMTTYTGDEAMEAVELFDGRTGRHVFISSGQVYLVRDGAGRPFREEEYDGPVVDEPSAGSSDYESWKYGVDKRAAEDVFAEAWTTRRFPVTTLRLPMVASERDHYGRIQGYLGRIEDGGPILVPDEEGLPLRHVYADDVARLVAGLATARAGIGRAFNISFGESMLLSQYLELLGQATGNEATVFRVPRSVLEREELLPDCSPFSGKWMSELDNARSLTELAGAGMAYTAPAVYLPRLVEDYRARWAGKGILSPGYVARGRELRFASSR